MQAGRHDENEFQHVPTGGIVLCVPVCRDYCALVNQCGLWAFDDCCRHCEYEGAEARSKGSDCEQAWIDGMASGGQLDCEGLDGFGTAYQCHEQWQRKTLGCGSPDYDGGGC